MLAGQRFWCYNLRRTGIFAVTLAMAFVAAACENDSESDGTSANGIYSGQYAVPNLELDPIPWIAEESGILDEENLDLEAVSFGAGTEVVHAIRSGKMAFGSPSTFATLSAYTQGATDLRVVGGRGTGASIVFLAPADTPIQDMDDLANKKVAVSSPNSITDYFGQLLAKQVEGLEVVYVGGPTEAWTAAQEGVVDVAWSVPPLSLSLVRDGEAKVVAEANDLIDNWTDTVLVTTQSFIDENPEAVERWLAGMSKTYDLVKSDPERAGEIAAEALEMDRPVAVDLMEFFAPILTIDIVRDDIEAMVDAGKELGLIKRDADVPLDAVIVDDFLPPRS